MKHNVMKRTLAGVMAVLTVAAYMPANVGGFLTEGNGIGIVASADVTYENVSTAEAFKTAVEEGKSVKLTADINITETVSVTADVTIDLNGYNITATNARALWVKSGTLTLTGEGTVSSTGDSFNPDSSVIRIGDGFYESDGTGDAPAALTVDKDVTVSTDKSYGITVFGRITAETLNVYGKVNVTSNRSAISGNGTSGLGSTVINIYDGASVTSSDAVAIYHPQAGSLNITGGTISGLGGVEAKAGDCIVSIKGDNTSITATGTPSHTPNDNGTSTTGYAIAAVENPGYAGSPAFTISGGTINGSVAIIEDRQVVDSKKGTISITGGRFISGGNKTDVSAFFDGATYSQDDYGYVREIATICWDEIDNTSGKTYYRTNPDYLTVFNNETVKLRKDITTKQLYIPNGYVGVIDLNGYNITVDGSGFVGYNSTEDSFADLTIKNTGGTAIINVGKSGTGSSAFTVANYGKFTVENGVTITTSLSDYTVYYKENTTVDVAGTVTNTVDNGTAIGGNRMTSTGSTLNINGGTVTAELGNAIYHPQDGTLNITGGTLSGKTAVYARMGNINISGGTFTANGAKADAGTIANGAGATGDALVFQSWDPPYGVPVVRISGGSFSSNFGSSVASYTQNNSSPSDISITGGTFSDTLNTFFIANGYTQDNQVVKKLEQQDISEFVTLTLDQTQFSYDGTEKSVGYSILDSDLSVGSEYVVEGTLSATDVGTYVVKVKGINGYKGEVTASWTITDSYSVTVNNDSTIETSYYSFGKSATVTAAVAPSGEKFSHWATDSTGNNIVSTSATYSFIVKNDVTLYPIYVEETKEVEQKAVLNLTTFQSTYNGKNAVGFDFTHSVPAGFTVKEVGLLYGTNKLCGANTSVSGYAKKNLKTDGASVGVSNLENSLKTRSTVKKYVANYKKNNGTVRFSYALGNTNNDAYANAVGYVTFVNDKNETVTVYSDAVAACYNTANN